MGLFDHWKEDIERKEKEREELYEPLTFRLYSEDARREAEVRILLYEPMLFRHWIEH